jgi:hypothetical protein
VDVVGPPVVGGVAGDDGAQRGRPLAGELQGVEAAPARAEHADRAGAPLLTGEPGDGLVEVGLLAGVVLVGHDPRARPGAPEVDAGDGVPVLGGETDVFRAIGRREVVLAVGQSLQQAGHSSRRPGVLDGGEVERRGEPGTVAERDPRLSLVNRVTDVPHAGHRGSRV